MFFALIEKVGAMGLYQKSLFVTLSMVSFYMGAVILITPFLFYEDQYDCSSFSSKKTCFDEICKMDLEDRRQYIPEEIYIRSFSNKFGDYRCAD